MSLPSIKTLATITHDRAGARKVRKILEEHTYSYAHSSGYDALRECDHLIVRGGNGVEHIEKGHNAKSPAIDYVNCGDPYTTTLMFVAGRGYVVGCWGDIVERGLYD